MLKRQGGWAGLLPLGLIAMVGVTGVVVTVEEAVDAPHPRFSDLIFGDETAQKPTQPTGKATYEIEGVQLRTETPPAPERK